MTGVQTCALPISDWFQSNYKSYKGMHLVAMLDEMANGYPVMIPASQRM